MDEEALCELCGSGGGAECLLLCENATNSKIRCNSGRHFYCFDPEYASLLTKEEADKFVYYCWGCTPYCDVDSADDTGDPHPALSSPTAARPRGRPRKKKQLVGSDSDSTYSPPSDADEAANETAQSHADTGPPTTLSETQAKHQAAPLQPISQDASAVVAATGKATAVSVASGGSAPSKPAGGLASPQRKAAAAKRTVKRGAGKVSQASRRLPGQGSGRVGTTVRAVEDPILKRLKAAKGAAKGGGRGAAAHAVPSGQLLRPSPLEDTETKATGNGTLPPERPHKKPRVEAADAGNAVRLAAPKPALTTRPSTEPHRTGPLDRQGSGPLPRAPPSTNRLDRSTADVLRRSAGAAKAAVPAAPKSTAQGERRGTPWRDMLAEPPPAPPTPEINRLWGGNLGWVASTGEWVEFDVLLFERRLPKPPDAILQQLLQTKAVINQLIATETQLRPGVIPLDAIPSKARYKVDEVLNRVTMLEDIDSEPDLYKIAAKPGTSQIWEFGLRVKQLHKTGTCLLTSISVEGKPLDLYLVPRVPRQNNANYLLLVSVSQDLPPPPPPPQNPSAPVLYPSHPLQSSFAAPHVHQAPGASTSLAPLESPRGSTSGGPGNSPLNNGQFAGQGALPVALGGRQKDPRRDVLLQNPNIPIPTPFSSPLPSAPSSPLPTSPTLGDPATHSNTQTGIPSFTLHDPNERVYEMKSFQPSQPSTETARWYVRDSAYSDYFTEDSRRLVCGEFTMQGMVDQMHAVPDWALYEYFYPSKEHFLEKLVKDGLVGMHWSLTLGKEVCAVLTWFPGATEAVLPKAVVVLPPRLTHAAPQSSAQSAGGNPKSPPASPMPVDRLQPDRPTAIKQEPQFSHQPTSWPRLPSPPSSALPPPPPSSALPPPPPAAMPRPIKLEPVNTDTRPPPTQPAVHGHYQSHTAANPALNNTPAHPPPSEATVNPQPASNVHKHQMQSPPRATHANSTAFGATAGPSASTSLAVEAVLPPPPPAIAQTSMPPPQSAFAHTSMLPPQSAFTHTSMPPPQFAFTLPSMPPPQSALHAAHTIMQPPPSAFVHPSMPPPQSVFSHASPPDPPPSMALRQAHSARTAAPIQSQMSRNGGLHSSPSLDPSAATQHLVAYFVKNRQSRVLSLMPGLEKMKKISLDRLKICLMNVQRGHNDWATSQVMDKLANAKYYHNIEVLMFPSQDELPYETLRKVSDVHVVLIPSCRVDEPFSSWQLATIPLKNWLCYEVLLLEEPLAGPVTYPERARESFLDLISKPESTKIPATVWSRSKLFDQGVSVVTDAATLVAAEPKLVLALLDSLDTAATKASGKFELHIRRDEWVLLRASLPPAVMAKMESLCNSTVPRIHLLNNAPLPAQDTLVDDAVQLLHNKEQPKQRAKKYRLVIAMYAQNATAEHKDRIVQHPAILGGDMAEVVQFVHLLLSGLLAS